MAFTLNRRLAQLVDGNGQLNTGKMPNDYITSDHVADNTITSAMLHTSFAVSTSNLTSIDTDDVSEGSTNLYYTDARVGTYISGNRTFGNITTTGYIAGPATFTIDPAAVGDNTGTVVIAGNLQVDGTTTTINSTTMLVDDLNITLASGAANAAAANGAGITVDGASATITYDGTNDEWDFNKDINTAGNITTQSGGLIVGTSDTTGGVITVYGNGTGNNEGGEIQLKMAADHDSTYDHFRLDVVNDTFRIGRTGTTDLSINSSGNATFAGTISSGAISSTGLTVTKTTQTDIASFVNNNGSIVLGHYGGGSQIDLGSNIAFRIRQGSAIPLSINTSGNATFAGTISSGRITTSDGIADTGQAGSATIFNESGSTADFRIESDTKPHMFFLDGGLNRIGINTGTPSHTLHILNEVSSDTIDENNGLVKMQSSGGNGMIFGTLASSPYSSYIQSAYVQDTSIAQYNLILNPIGGNVGIGTTSPAQKLDVNGKIRFTPNTADTNYSADIGARYDSAHPFELSVKNNGSSAEYFGVYADAGGANNRVVFPTGNVGIGTTDPTGKLHVSGGRAGVISTENSWGQFRVGNTNDAETSLAFVTGATESDFLNDGDPACAYKVILGINPYSAGTRNFGIGNDTIANYHTIWTEAGHQLPRVDNTYDLGSATKGFKNIHLSSDLHVGGHIIGDDDTSYMRMNAGPSGGGAIYLNGSTRTNFENHIQYMADVHNFGDVDGSPINTLQVVSDSELVTINGRLTVTKPIQTTTDSGTRMYTGLATGSHYNSTGFLILDTTIPSPNVSGNNMFSIHINGYSYASSTGGIIDLKVGTYSGESYFHNASYTGSNIPDKWVNNIRFARKTASNTVSIILGDSGTSQPIEIAATLFIQGFGVTSTSYAEGWDWKISTNTNDYSSLTKVEEKSTKRPSFSATSSGFSVSTGWQVISDSMSQTHDGPDDNYNPSNGRFTPQLPGWYQFNFGGWATYNSSTGQERYAVAFAKNSSMQYLAGGNYSSTDSPLAGAGQRVYLNGSTDYVELRAYSSVATTWGGGSHHVWWDGYWTGS